MEVTDAIDRWMDGKFTTKEVMLATGLRSVRELYAEVRFDAHDRENEMEFEDMNALLADEDQAAYEQGAWYVFAHYLQENPDGLPRIVRVLRRENYLGRHVRILRHKPQAA